MSISNKYYAPRVQRFSVNTEGRDFLHADAHGAFDLLKSGLKEAGFVLGRDRVFTPGDLLDRGLDSFRALPYLQMPGVRSSRGNHEDMLIGLYAERDPRIDDYPQETLEFLANQFGMEWWLPLTGEQRFEMLEAIRQLPLVMEVETERGRVGIVHADIPAGMHWDTFVQGVEEGDPKICATALWGRNRIERRDARGVPGIDRVFVGHTIQWSGPVRLGNVYFLDTGAIFGQTLRGAPLEGHFTLASLMANSAVLVNNTPKPKLIEVLALDDLSRPFSNYCSET